MQLIQFSDDEEEKKVEGPPEMTDVLMEDMKDQIVEEKKEEPDSPVSQPSERS